MRTLLRVTVLFLCACSPPSERDAPVPGTNSGACDVEATGEIHLSSKDRRDVIRASVRGKSCDGAVFSLSIQAPDGRTIYRYQKRLRPFLSILAEVSDADAQVRARRLVESTILGAEGRTSSSLPPYQPGEFEPDGMSTAQILVPQADYTRLREADGPLFHHATGWEIGRDVVFDPAKDVAVAVLESWL